MVPRLDIIKKQQLAMYMVKLGVARAGKGAKLEKEERLEKQR